MKLFKKELNFKEFLRKKKEKREENNKKLKELKEKIRDKETQEIEPIIVESEPQGLKSKLDNVSKKLDVLTKRNVKSEQKELGIPLKLKRQMKKLAIKNKMFVLYLTNNKTIIPQVHEVIDETITIDGKPHAANASSTFLWKGKYPAMIVPEWDLMPLNAQKSYNDARDNHRLAEPVAVAIRMMENSQNPSKPKMSNKAWVFIGLAVIAGIYVLVGG